MRYYYLWKNRRDILEMRSTWSKRIRHRWMCVSACVFRMYMRSVCHILAYRSFTICSISGMTYIARECILRGWIWIRSCVSSIFRCLHWKRRSRSGILIFSGSRCSMRCVIPIFCRFLIFPGSHLRQRKGRWRIRS